MKKIDLQNIDLNQFESKKTEKISLEILKEKIFKNQKKFQTEFFKIKEDFVKSFDRLEKFFISVALVFIFTVCYFLFFTLPVFHKIDSIKTENLIRKNNIPILKEDLTKVKSLHKKLGSLKEKIEFLKLTVPETQKEEEVVINLGTLLAKNHIPNPKKFSWVEQKPGVINSNKINEYFQVYLYSFSSVASFDNLLNFLIDLKNNQRVLDLKSIKIFPISTGEVHFNLDLWSYNLRN
jgi:Tfp pilus assembly protein PilO